MSTEIMFDRRKMAYLIVSKSVVAMAMEGIPFGRVRD